MKYFITYYLMFTKPKIYGKAWKVSHAKRPHAILSIIISELNKKTKVE